YATLNDYNHNMELAKAADGRIDPARVRDGNGRLSDEVRKTTWRSILRPRTLVYFLIWAAIGLFMVYHVATRDRMDLNVLHDRNPLFVQLSDG
ncbi:MAG: cytochrome c oxidase accessory protein CcoG, partial [Gemmatimonadetes bacterium]|nr:cytochrome c oxidase accessory protein CcoG [Gemmatimonadota bacterium]NIS01365.1 cytochrome c oxidase accessory protein CcoG [Gemmatimonadota bacterium]NIT67105.1 cytochrome c oxidase accessory protein CcoG [Gemmatimonadota bacterium]NIV23891.1 cytochrome c oxidase accessory protein CcoG [Gemmatimonadota bacterium]NIW75790.1 cytochrome c oxidase accessory protein CcoG [Gemmatimonadota bacterium]